MGSMVVMSESILKVGKIVEEKAKAEAQKREEQAAATAKARTAEAEAAFKKAMNKEKMGSNDWKALIMYVVPLDGKEDASRTSSYSTIAKCRERLAQTAKPWAEYFDVNAPVPAPVGLGEADAVPAVADEVVGAVEVLMGLGNAVAI